MAQLAVAATGAGTDGGATNLSSIDVAHPASVGAGNLLILGLLAGVHSTGFVKPTGWTELPGLTSEFNFGTVATIGETCAMGYYKWASGSESGNLTVTRSTGTDFFLGRMARVDGFTATGGDPFADTSVSNGTDASIESPAVGPATSDNDLGFAFIFVGDDNALGPLDEAVETIEWSETTAEFVTAFGNDGALSINHCASVTNGVNIPANLETMAAADPWFVWTCVLKESAGVPGGATVRALSLLGVG